MATHLPASGPPAIVWCLKCKGIVPQIQDKNSRDTNCIKLHPKEVGVISEDQMQEMLNRGTWELKMTNRIRRMA